MTRRIEKTVFISYRRTDIAWAFCIYQDLTHHGFDVFLDYQKINSGNFEKVILENIRARAHFIVILAPSALERCSEPGDWLRREIEAALDEKRNIIPIMLEGFDFGSHQVKEVLTGKLTALSSYSGMRLISDYIEAGLEKLRDRYLKIALEDVHLHTLAVDARKITEIQKAVANEAPPIEISLLTAREWLEKGYLYEELGNHKEAIRCYSEAIHLNPNDTDAYYNRGLSYQLNGNLNEAAKDFNKTILNILPFQVEISENLKKFTRTRFRINFNDKHTLALLDELDNARDSGNLARTTQVITRLIDKAFTNSLDSEKPLLWATLLICHNLPERAIKLINRVLPNIENRYKPEYLYVHALAYYEREDFERVIVECRIGTSEFAEDPRFYHLLGLAISKLISVDGKITHWEDAINNTHKAYVLIAKHGGDRDLQGVLANNLAYFLYRRNEPGDIEQAFHYITELQRAIPAYDESPEFLNTIGIIYGELALLEKDKAIQEQYRTKALESLGKAYTIARKTLVEIEDVDEYEKDLHEAQQQLNLFVST